jgi:hypothetical protein
MTYTSTKRSRLLSPVAFGIHHRISADLQRFFEESVGHSSFFFYEFFLEKAITRGRRLEEILLSAQAVTAPFLSRVIYKTGFMPALNLQILLDLKRVEDVESVPLTRENLERYWTDADSMHCSINETELLRALVEKWIEPSNEDHPEYLSKETEIKRDGDIVVAVGSLSAENLRNQYPAKIIEEAKRNPQAALAKLREYELVLLPWLGSKSIEQIGIVSVSISSHTVFWGECIVLFPHIKGRAPASEERWMADLKELVRKRVADVYAPMLALLENYIYEDELRDKLKSNQEGEQHSVDQTFLFRGIDYAWLTANKEFLQRVGSGLEARGTLTPDLTGLTTADHVYISLLCQCSKDPGLWKGLGKLDKALIELWADRLVHLLSNPAEVRKSLVFAKYLVASPSMINCTLQAAALRHTAEEKEGRAVKAALVVGGPGSGKDSMAQLIRLFSPGYRFGGIKTLNMAMFRPKEAAVPLLIGLEVQHRNSDLDSSVIISLDGLLTRSLKEDALKKLTMKIDVQHARGFTFIFDELNSLDLDTQGALLRLLENAELQPLGGLQPLPGPMNVLVIGVMNEDPQMIMKRRTMDRILREKQLFGGIVGEVLYEVFRGQRRMRDDLYYRLVRGGEIHIPELRDRREDIPILFYFIIVSELRSLCPRDAEGGWDVELSVYETLMNPSLQWEGNLRELQAVARRTVVEAVEEYEMHGSLGNLVVIRGAHARRALERVAPGV